MNREVHVRFCEGLGVKFPGPTRPNAVRMALILNFRRTHVSLWAGGPSKDREVAAAATGMNRRADHLAGRMAARIGVLKARGRRWSGRFRGTYLQWHNQLVTHTIRQREASMSGRLYLSAIACTWIYFSLVALAGAQQCEGFLTPDMTVDLTKKDTYAFLDSAMCHKNYEEFKKSYGADTGAKYFEISGRGNFTSDNYEKRQTSDCNRLTKQESDQSLYYHSAKIIPQKAGADYLECVRRQTLVCMFSPGEDVLTLEIYYYSDDDGRAKITSIQPTNIKVPSKVLKEGDFLKKNATFVVTTIIDPSKATRFTMQTTIGRKGEPCTAYRPATPPFPIRERITQFCAGNAAMCDQLFKTSAGARGQARVTFTVASGLPGEFGRHRAPIRLHFLVNGQERGTRDFGYKDDTGQIGHGVLTNFLDLGQVDAKDVIGLRAEVLDGGCGGVPLKLNSWGGELTLMITR